MQGKVKKTDALFVWVSRMSVPSVCLAPAHEPAALLSFNAVMKKAAGNQLFMLNSRKYHGPNDSMQQA